MKTGTLLQSFLLAAGLVGLASAGSDQYGALAAVLAFMAAGFLILARVIGLGFRRTSCRARCCWSCFFSPHPWPICRRGYSGSTPRKIPSAYFRRFGQKPLQCRQGD